MTKKEEACEERYCYLPKGHGGLHHVKARICDTKQEELIEGMREVLSEDLILCSITHENPPPHRDCYEDCGVLSLQGGKHRKCMDCWNEYIEGLILRLLAKQDVWS